MNPNTLYQLSENEYGFYMEEEKKPTYPVRPDEIMIYVDQSLISPYEGYGSVSCDSNYFSLKISTVRNFDVVMSGYINRSNNSLCCTITKTEDNKISLQLMVGSSSISVNDSFSNQLSQSVSFDYDPGSFQNGVNGCRIDIYTSNRPNSYSECLFLCFDWMPVGVTKGIYRSNGYNDGSITKANFQLDRLKTNPKFV